MESSLPTQPVDLEAARALGEYFLEIVAAPGFAPEALELLRKKRNLRIMQFARSVPDELAHELRLRSALGGVLAENDDPSAPSEEWHVVSRRHPSAQQWHDLAFAWDVVRHVKSNGIVIVKGGTTRGICAGQTNRVSAVKIAAVRAGRARSRAQPAQATAFFLFRTVWRRPSRAAAPQLSRRGGSVRDTEVIAAADALGVALVFSSYRYFLH